jgi:hypothetical protein
MRAIQLWPDERLVSWADADNLHRLHVSHGKIYMTDQRLLFQGSFFPLSLAPLGHRHAWRLTDIEEIGESRHHQTLFLRRHLYLIVRGEPHFFTLADREQWLELLAAAGIRRAI